MKKLVPAFECVTNLMSEGSQCFPCNPCSPDRVENGNQCNPCNPCSPDRVENGHQCNPCNPCSPNRIEDGGQCHPCYPCSPDQLSEGGQCHPCHPCSPDQIQSNDSGSSGCFISSACVECMGLPDDCEELQVLRKFRDDRKTHDTQFREMIKEYYTTAPYLVDIINKQTNRKEIYSDIYHQMVLRCVNLIIKNKEDEAIDLYRTTFLNLCSRYAEL